MKRVGSSLVLVAMIAVGGFFFAACSADSKVAESGADFTQSKSEAAQYTVTVAQIVTHASLDASVEGFKTALADAGMDVVYQDFNANNDQQMIPSIAASVESLKPDLVLAVGTPVAQGMAQAITDVPILFTAVTDPKSAGIVETDEVPGGNVSGTTDKNPVKQQLELVREIVPNAKKLGVIYSPGEENSVVQVEWVKDQADSLGLQVIESAVPETRDVQQGAQSLNVDAIYMPTDNTVISSMDSVLQVAESKGIPVFSADGDSVENGAVATYGISYFDLGYQTGEMAVEILVGGGDISTMSVESQENLLLYVNTEAAKRMGVVLPADVLKRAAPETTFSE